MTYTLIGSTTLASAASSVTFSSITQDYRDLVLVVSANRSAYVQINGDTGANYPYVFIYGLISGTSTFAGASANTSTSFVFYSESVVQIFDYSATDKHKSVLNRSGSSTIVEARANSWANTDAVTSLLIYANVDTFDTGSTFYLYGIAG